MGHRYAILEAPSALGHIPEHLGVERAPGVLLEAGLADGLSARRAGCLPAGGYSSVPDPRTKVMNPQPPYEARLPGSPGSRDHRDAARIISTS